MSSALFFPIYIGSLFVVGMLAKKAMASPYIAGAYGIFLSSYFNLQFKPMVFVILTLYLTCMLGNGIPEAEGISLGQTMLLNNGKINISINPIKTFAAKAIFLALFTLIPLPEPPAHLTGIGALVVVSVLMFLNQGNNPKNANIWVLAITVAIQAGLIWFVSTWCQQESDDLGGMLSLMCFVSVPSFLFPPKGQHHEIADDRFFFRIFPCLVSWLLTFYTPGLSSSAVASSLFPADHHRLLAMSALEGAIEGYVLNQLLSSNVNHKSPLGDLLSADPTRWGSFTVDISFYPVIILAVSLSILAAFLSPCLPFKISRKITAALLVMQGTVLGGSSTWLYILTGFICLGVRALLEDPDDSSLATAFIVPTLF